ncbi:conserved domain protein [Peptoniphilus sp. oral taxon 375 str. F0436]|nr:conserved domain protein [Peptoniphilus sp. oral taxon 375 str. F0436]
MLAGFGDNLKIESSILNGLGYIVHLEKKNGNNCKKLKYLVNSTVTEDAKL